MWPAGKDEGIQSPSLLPPPPHSSPIPPSPRPSISLTAYVDFKYHIYLVTGGGTRVSCRTTCYSVQPGKAASPASPLGLCPRHHWDAEPFIACLHGPLDICRQLCGRRARTKVSWTNRGVKCCTPSLSPPPPPPPQV